MRLNRPICGGGIAVVRALRPPLQPPVCAGWPGRPAPPQTGKTRATQPARARSDGALAAEVAVRSWDRVPRMVTSVSTRHWPRHHGPAITAALLAALVAGAGAGAARAEPGTLTLARAVALARQSNERARIAGEQADAAQARLAHARAFFFPDLVASGTYVRRSHQTVRDVGGSQVTIQSQDALSGNLTASLTLFDARGFPLYRQARLERDAARLGAIEQRRLLSFDVANAFLETLGQEQVVRAAKRRVAFAKDSLVDARARVSAGLAGSNDRTRAELDVATAARELAADRGQLARAYLELGYLIGRPVHGPLVPPARLLAQAARPLPAAAPGSLARQAAHRRLDLAAQADHVAAERAAALEPALRALPALGAVGEVLATNESGFSGRQTDWFLGLNLTWTLWDGGERRADRHEHQAQAAIAQLDLEAQRRAAFRDVASARIALDSAQAEVSEARAATTAAGKNADEAAALYRQGLARAIEVADANTGRFDAEVALARAQFGLGQALLDLRAALGLDPFGREPPR